MPHLIEVGFKGNRKDFFLWEHDELPPLKAAVIVEADRGEDLGFVHSVGELADKRNAGTPHGYGAAGTTKKARRLATSDEVVRAAELREQDEETRRRAMERVKANDLVMKLSDAEWQWDRKKLTLYFTAERRVDFRTLVRELASMFRTRIELKQIGVRDEAKRLDGIGRCGRQYCSSSWLPELRPVNLGVAKDQHLSLNPSQISGACGRLMCCLRYEHEFYVQSRKRFPKEGRIIRTTRGEEKIVSNDIFRESVTLRGEDGEFRTITLAEFRDETSSSGSSAAATESARHAITEEEDDVELIVDEELLLDTEAHSADVMTIQIEPIVESQPVVETTTDAAELVESTESTEPTEEPTEATESTDAGAAETAEGRERRPHRRRGRRGGRRNRPGGRGPRDEPGGSAPDASEE
jgi:cell fate regulator YaaT (PSP1 superfamily)